MQRAVSYMAVGLKIDGDAYGEPRKRAIADFGHSL